MQKFMEWEIKNSLCLDAEIYFIENAMIGLRHETETKALPGQTIYKVRALRIRRFTYGAGWDKGLV